MSASLRSTFEKLSAWIGFAAALFFAACNILGGLAPAAAEPSGHLAISTPTRPIGDAKRFALVIGNAAYQRVVTLKNPTNDARAVGEGLRDLGYEVHLALEGMNDAIDGFLKRIEPGSETLVYYAGHGIEVQGSNYLLPIDIAPMNADQERRLRSDAVNLTDLLTDLQQHQARVTLVILDACRDNPLQIAGTRSLGSARGLGKVEPPRGTFVMFSAGVGETALDDLGPGDSEKNGLFTRKLLGLLSQEALELHAMTIRLREEVRVAALGVGHQQFLGYYDQLTGQFFFRPPAVEPRVQNACDSLVDPDAAQQAVLASDTEAAVQACTRATADFPAEVRFYHLLITAQENQSFKRAMTAENLEAAQGYLALYPRGRFVDAVRARRAGFIPGPAPTPVSPTSTPAPVPDKQEITRVLKTELRRVGCYAGNIDGTWGRPASKALQRFNELAGTKLNAQTASLDSVTAVRERSGRVCPVVCAPGQKAEGDHCIPITCPQGLILTSTGQCVRRQERSQPMVVHQEPQPRPMIPPPTPNSRCVTVGGQTYCP